MLSMSSVPVIYTAALAENPNNWRALRNAIAAAILDDEFLFKLGEVSSTQIVAIVS
jgi:hypothetical protein